MSIGIDFALRANTAQFTKAMAAARNSIADTQRAAKQFGAGDFIKGAGLAAGVGLLVRGFMNATEQAKEMAAELQKAGKEIPANVAALARAGDAMEGLKKSTFTAFGSVAGFMEKVGLLAGKIVYGSEAAADAQKRLGDEAKAAAKAVADADRASARKERTDYDRDREMKTGSFGQRRSTLFGEREALRDAMDKTEKGSAERERASLALKRKQDEIADLDEEERKQKAQAKKETDAKAEQAKKDRKELVDKFAPSVEQLAEMDVGGFAKGDDPRLKARKILEKEKFAAAAAGRGDIKTALKFGTEADAMRKSLSSVTGSGTALTAETAKSAFTEALDATNAKLDKLETAFHGVIKAQ